MPRSRAADMPLDHLGINIPDVPPARDYYGVMPLVGFKPFFAGDDWCSYAPASGSGTQLFFYTAQDDGVPLLPAPTRPAAPVLPGGLRASGRVGTRLGARPGREVLHERGRSPSTTRTTTPHSGSIPTVSNSRSCPSNTWSDGDCRASAADRGGGVSRDPRGHGLICILSYREKRSSYRIPSLLP